MLFNILQEYQCNVCKKKFKVVKTSDGYIFYDSEFSYIDLSYNKEFVPGRFNPVCKYCKSKDVIFKRSFFNHLI